MYLQVTATNEMVSKVDFYANRIGISRSAFCAMLINDGLVKYAQTDEVSDALIKQFSELITKEVKKVDIKKLVAECVAEQQ